VPINFYSATLCGVQPFLVSHEWVLKRLNGSSWFFGREATLGLSYIVLLVLYLVYRPVCKMVLTEFLSGIKFVGP